MNITQENLILVDTDCSDKDQVLERLTDLLDSDGRLINRTEYITEVRHREEVYSTAIGFNVAIPHGKTEAVKSTSIAFARLRNPITWDEEQVNLVFLLAVPASEAGNKHLEILAALSRRLMHEDYREQLQTAQSKSEILKLVNVI